MTINSKVFGSPGRRSAPGDFCFVKGFVYSACRFQPMFVVANRMEAENEIEWAIYSRSESVDC